MATERGKKAEKAAALRALVFEPPFAPSGKKFYGDEVPS